MQSVRHFRLFVVLLHISVFAVGENQPGIEHITSSNGLSHNTIRCMIQDETGFMWFGSLNGLNRYDGVKMRSFIPESKNPTSLSSGKVKELHQDSYGHIWVRTYSDIMHCYSPQAENFIPLYLNKTDQFVKYKYFYEDNQKNVWLSGISAGCVKISFANGKAVATRFETGRLPNSLPSNVVSDVFQDSKNNTWILTTKGISLYKGNTVSNVALKKGDESNYTKTHEINGKVYFVGAGGKIKTYNLKTAGFERDLLLQPATRVFQSSHLGNFILISTVNSGIYVLNVVTGKFIPGEMFFGEKISGSAYFLTNQNGDVLTYNNTGNVWIWIKQSNKIVKLNLIPGAILRLIDEERYQFLADKRGNLWISTYGNGLFSYNLYSGRLNHFAHSKRTIGLSSNYLLSIVLDRNENIWVGTENMGVDKLTFVNRNVQIYFPDHENVLQNGNIIRSFMEDNEHNIWVATKAGNLYKYDSTLSKKQTLYENGYNVYSMLQDKNGSVWLATKKTGIIELKNGKLSGAVQYKNTDKPGSLSNNTVFALTTDLKGRIWAATFGGGVCVKTVNGTSSEFRTFFNDDEWVRFTRHIFRDRKGEIWVGTTNGILRFNPDSLLQNPKAYKYYLFTVESKDCLSNPDVRYIFQDTKGNMWFTTAGGGLNKFIGETPDGNGRFKVYNNTMGMAYDNMLAMLEDKTGNFWISSENGLHKLNPKENLFQYFRFSDDFSSNSFSEGACLSCSDGKMLWGTLNGFYAFKPTDLLEKKKENKVVLTGFSIYDQQAEIAPKNAPLTKSVSFSDRVELKASDKVFHIEFANLDFSNTKANQYMYMLENYEKRWNASGAVNVATYRNVPPGNYTFLVKSINNEGVWDDNVTRLEIEIHPPFWLSSFAIILYFLLLSGAAFFALRLIKKFNDLNNAVKVERQLTDYKLRFFTNISHEFRTPLTLIKGSVDTLIELKNKMSEPLQLLVNDLDKNTSHLLRLIDQLLEFRKLQNNKQKLNLQNTDPVVFVNEIYMSFSNVAHKSHIDYSFFSSGPSVLVPIDQNKVDKIVFNLLSNAFKFTPRGGKITVTTEVDEAAGVVRIAVSDNGIGIPAEKQNLLFSRFMQINFSASGTGIGLSLVNEFTALHKGSVRFNENLGGGSVFTVELPLNAGVYLTEDFLTSQTVVVKEEKEQTYNLSEFIVHTDETMLNLMSITPVEGKKYKILVIDDNDDIRDFLNDKLSPYFEVMTAEDGDVGFRMSTENDPDLIICDVMMPGMNGFDLTKKLKDDFNTCHIPVILLTAYISDDHNSEGIEAGAEAYISKPFSMKHLMLQINKLLEKNEKLHKHYAGNEPVKELIVENKLDIPERDNLFLKMVEDILDKHLTEPEFSVDEFAAYANTGRTLFFKKVKFLTGYSPNELIRVRRMIKAAELLKTYKYNVSEVSYKVGINDPFYFSKCFKAQFGCSPSHYLNS